MALLKNNWSFLDERRNSWGTCHVIDNKEETVLLVDLPGARREDISLHYKSGRIEIQASRRADWDGGAERQIKRSVAIPLDPETISARLENGVLEIRARHAEGSREITIS